jgi:hypothetical protein
MLKTCRLNSETSGDNAQDSKPRAFHFVAPAKVLLSLRWISLYLVLTRSMLQRFGGHLRFLRL